MRKIIAILLSALMVVMSGCSSDSNTADSPQKANSGIPSIEEQLGINESDIKFDNLSDPDLRRYVEDTIYSDLVYRLADEGYYVENVEARYVSKEYMEELEYNSKTNIYFGFTLDDLLKQFGDEKYIFSLGDDGTTVVKEFQNYDDTYEKAIKNVVIGSGVILICITVSAATGGTAPAVSMVFAASAKSATFFALSSGTISGVASGIVTGVRTEDFDAALKSAAENGSEAFKWGAITGAITGGAGEAAGLRGATANGLSMNEAATIQKEAKYPLDVIKQFKNMDQYQNCKKAGLKPQMINGKTALVREIDWKYTDELGRTNYQRVIEDGLSPIDPVSGKAYELHHIGQKTDSTLAILTKAEHREGGNDLIWHNKAKGSTVHSPGNKASWEAQRQAFWETLARYQRGTK